MTTEDRIRMNKDTVGTCSFLGLKLDFLDRRAYNVPEHINACEWIEIFIKDMNSNMIFYFLSTMQDSLFKVIKRTNSLGFQRRNGIRMIITTFVRSTFWMPWKRNRNLNSPVASFLEHLITNNIRYCFCGTNHESAIGILSGRGIHLPSERQKRDFSSGKGFYLRNNVNDALRWASSTTTKPDILVFRVNLGAFFNSKTRKLGLTDQGQGRLCLHLGLEKSHEILREYDLMEGPLATVGRRTPLSNNGGEQVFEPKPSSYQMCVISDDFADCFEQNL